LRVADTEAKAAAAGASDVHLGHSTVLTGERGGKYPHGNSLLVRGREETLLVDPSLSVLPRRGELESVDWVLLSHCHEDHLAGAHLFADRPLRLHELDRPGMDSLDALMEIYGYAEPIGTPWRAALVERFHYAPRPDAEGFAAGAVFDLGGVRVHAIHAPGHTRGHCAFYVEPDDVLYLGDIDLSSFGPYYGDAWSDLEDFEQTLLRVRGIHARWYATFHHIGVIEGREAFLERLARFAAVIGDRERRLLEYLAEPRTLGEIARHRFVYRPGDPVAFAVAVELRSMGQHVARLLRDGRVVETHGERYRAAG
jgi:glyoxylase-like metal-dependent hydrolase (beta-lactamase superfamily II)